MKKILYTFCTLLCFMLVISSCEDEKNAPEGGAYVEITVLNQSGTPQKHEMVYMFKAIDPNELINANLASKEGVTDLDGKVKFFLTYEELIYVDDSSEMQLYFILYESIANDEIIIKGEGSTTVKYGDEKEITIIVPN